MKNRRKQLDELYETYIEELENHATPHKGMKAMIESVKAEIQQEEQEVNPEPLKHAIERFKSDAIKRQIGWNFPNEIYIECTGVIAACDQILEWMEKEQSVTFKEPEYDEKTAKLIGDAGELAKEKAGKEQRRDYPVAKESYGLNCYKCGNPYWSKEAFPKPQLCPVCKEQSEPINSPLTEKVLRNELIKFKKYEVKHCFRIIPLIEIDEYLKTK